MTNFEYLRARLYAQAGLFPNIPRMPPSTLLTTLAKTEWSETFETYMRNRLIIGALRYGPINTPKPRYNRMAGICKRLNQYTTTGNLECLVDVANLALLEFVEGTHPKRHWRALDDDHACV